MTATQIMPYEIKTERVSTSRLIETDLANVTFGRVFTDHMLVSEYYNGDWHDTAILPFQNISLSPAATVLHYGQEIFEGLKAYKGSDGNTYLFRPYENWVRMNHSAHRMAMPEIPEEIFLGGIQKLISLDKNWIPPHRDSSLYIRPFMIAADEYVGIKTSETYKFIIFACPVNAYYSEPVKVKIEQFYVRACRGGTGEAKTGGNYSSSLFPVGEAQKEGYKQMLWTDSVEHKWIEESGTMNVFFVIDDKVITPSLSGSILHGVTRDSVLTLLRDNEYKVEERRISVDEVVQALRDGRLKEAFGTGTAATIAHISAIGYEDQQFNLPPVEGWEVANWLLSTLDKIKHAEIPDKYGWLVKVD